MRAVNKRTILKPAELTSTDCLAHLDLMIQNPSIDAEAKYYRGTIELPNGKKEHKVAEALKTLYKLKCAYCESSTHEPEVEHYRPKARVIGGPKRNRGYYWLAYEWTNLVPSCHDCNSITRKGNRFPVAHLRKSTHPVTNTLPPVLDTSMNLCDSLYLTSEQPLLVHPEYCADPTTHFVFNRQGKILGKTQQGRMTIRVLDLARSELNGRRRTIYEYYYNRLNQLILDYKNPLSGFNTTIFEWLVKRLVEEIVKGSLDVAAEYTLFRKFLVSKIDYFFINPLLPVYQQETRIAISKALQSI